MGKDAPWRGPAGRRREAVWDAVPPATLEGLVDALGSSGRSLITVLIRLVVLDVRHVRQGGSHRGAAQRRESRLAVAVKVIDLTPPCLFHS